jgi:hypothetical protein
VGKHSSLFYSSVSNREKTFYNFVSSALTADRILYNYAIELCQSAALDELFGNPDECFQVSLLRLFNDDATLSQTASVIQISVGRDRLMMTLTQRYNT